MAKMRSIVADIIRGSVGGLTYLSGPGNAIVVRQRTSPVNPNSTFQSQIRGAFADASAVWKNLNDTNRALWDDYARSLTYTDAIGDKKVTGRNVFLSNYGLAKYLDDRGESVGGLLGTAPTIPGFLSVSDFDIGAPQAAGTGVSISFGNPNSEAITVTIYRSVGFNTSRRTYKGQFEAETLQTFAVPAGTGGTVDVACPTSGLAYFFKIRAITSDDPYRVSSQSILRGVAQTTI